MTPVTERRRGLRMGVDRGLVFLRSSGVPSIACALSDLSAHGFSCLAPLQTLDAETAKRWRAKLSSAGLKMSVDISSPPELPGLHLDVETRYSRETGAGMTIGFAFHDLDSRDANTIKQALPNLFKSPASARNKADAEDDPPPKARSSQSIVVSPYDEPLPHDDLYYGKKLGRILIDLSKLTEAQLEEFELDARIAKEPLGRFLLSRAVISPADLCSALALQAGLPIVDLGDTEIGPELLTIFPPLTMLRYQFIPFAQTSQTVSIATTRPLPREFVFKLRRKCMRKILLFIAPDDVVSAKLYKTRPNSERKLRKHRRFELAVPVHFYFAKSLNSRQQGLLFDGRTLMVSEGGLTIGTHENIAAQGCSIRARFTLPPDTVDGLYAIRHTRRRSTENFADTPWLTGLEVIDMSAAGRAALKALCERLTVWQKAEAKLNQTA